MRVFTYLLACGFCCISVSLAAAAPPEGKGPPGAGPQGFGAKAGLGQKQAGQGEQGQGPGEGKGPPGGPGGMPPHPLLMIFDTDHDGSISATEFESVTKELKGLDKNSDGKLTADELPAPPGPPGGGEGKGPPPGLAQGAAGEGKGPKNGQGPPGQGGEGGMRPNPVLMVMDTDRDGAVSSTEFETAIAGIKSLDKNGDGKLTMDELPRPGQGKGGGQGQQGASGKGPQQGQGQFQGKGPQQGQGQGPPGGPGKGPPGGGPPNKN